MIPNRWSCPYSEEELPHLLGYFRNIEILSLFGGFSDKASIQI